MKLIFNALLILSQSTFAADYTYKYVTKFEFDMIAAGGKTDKAVVLDKKNGTSKAICYTPYTEPCALTVATSNVGKDDSCTCSNEFGDVQGSYNPFAYNPAHAQKQKTVAPAAAAASAEASTASSAAR